MTYKGKLSRPSMPLQPQCGTLNDLRRWRAHWRSKRDCGVRLLLDEYDIAQSAIEGENGQLRSLIYAMACDHVPYFSPRRRKGSKWDRYSRARFLFDVVTGLKKKKPIDAAIQVARKRLPAALKMAKTSALRKQYALSAKFFRNEVRVTKDFNIVPRSPTMSRLWDSDLRGPIPITGRVMPDPENADQMIAEFED